MDIFKDERFIKPYVNILVDLVFHDQEVILEAIENMLQSENKDELSLSDDEIRSVTNLAIKHYNEYINLVNQVEDTNNEDV